MLLVAFMSAAHVAAPLLLRWKASGGHVVAASRSSQWQYVLSEADFGSSYDCYPLSCVKPKPIGVKIQEQMLQDSVSLSVFLLDKRQ